MAVKVHNATWRMLALAPLIVVAGCCCAAIPLPGENQCPTDARRLYCSCGEEAVRRCPCGPDSQFYGLKPTCWREWPEGWQCNGCEGMPYVDRALCGEPVAESPACVEPTTQEPATEKADFSNPFRGKAEAVDRPLPSETPQATPTTSAPVKKAPAPVVPPQPTPTAPPALEKTPADTAPPKEAPTESAPQATKSTMEKPTDNATRVAAATPAPQEVSTPSSPIIQVEATVPNAIPFVPAAVKMPAAAPILIAPLNAPALAVAPTPEPQPVPIAAAPKCEKKPAEKPSLQWTETKAAKRRAEDPRLPSRVEQHLINNLRL